MNKYTKIVDKTAVLLLNWNGYNDTIKCLESLVNSNCFINEENVYVIDNNSQIDPTKDILDKFKYVNVLRTSKNLGYAGGNNYGLKVIIKKEYEYILILNNDTEVEKEFIFPMIDSLLNNADVGIIVPKVKMFFYPDRLYHAGGYISRISGTGKLIGFMEKDGLEYSELKRITFANGCCMLIRKEVINKIGLLDEYFFSYGEDADYSIRALKAGINIIYNPNAIIYHKVNIEEGKRESTYYLYYLYRSYGILLRKQLKKKIKISSLIYFIVYLPYSVLKRIIRGNYSGAITIIKGYLNINNVKIKDTLN